MADWDREKTISASPEQLETMIQNANVSRDVEVMKATELVDEQITEDFTFAREACADYCTRENHGAVAALLTVAMAIARVGEKWKRSSGTE